MNVIYLILNVDKNMYMREDGRLTYFKKWDAERALQKAHERFPKDEFKILKFIETIEYDEVEYD